MAQSFYNVESAAGAVAAGEDMFTENKEQWTVPSVPRIITKIKITGSAAQGDFTAELVVGQKIVAKLTNTLEGANKVGNKDDEINIGAYVGPSAPIQLIVRDPSGTNPIHYTIWLKPFRKRRRFGRIRYRSRNYRNYRRRY